MDFFASDFAHIFVIYPAILLSALLGVVHSQVGQMCTFFILENCSMQLFAQGLCPLGLVGSYAIDSMVSDAPPVVVKLIHDVVQTAIARANK